MHPDQSSSRACARHSSGRRAQMQRRQTTDRRQRHQKPHNPEQYDLAIQFQQGATPEQAPACERHAYRQPIGGIAEEIQTDIGKPGPGYTAKIM